MPYRNKSMKQTDSTKKSLSSDKWRRSTTHHSSVRSSISQKTDDFVMEHTDLEQNWEAEFFGVGKDNESQSSEQENEVTLSKKQTHLLATLVPDVLIGLDRFDEKEPKRLVGVLLMADVSGFTALSERYNRTGKEGTYRLTATLNAYLGALVELIYRKGGDVLKFAGDAFLALWKVNKKHYISHIIHCVISCAEAIQKTFGVYETDVKVNLKVKLAIAAGNILFAPIGVGSDKNFVVTGQPVFEAKLAESKCQSGDIIVAPTAWDHCFSRNYKYTLVENHAKIIAILYEPNDVNAVNPHHIYKNNFKRSHTPLYGVEDLTENLLRSSLSLDPGDILRREETLSVRPIVSKAYKRRIGAYLRNFMIRPVLQQVDANQPLEYLTEMRQVTVMFLTLKPKQCSYAELIKIVDNAYQITCRMVYKFMGCVNKIILFDKDVMILVIFGLRGFKHESEALAGLKCAYGVRRTVSALDGVVYVSVGVTTGQVYCGVVGHPLRREFTAIGAVVNKAARLMCAFPNKVSCDEETLIKSKMSPSNFVLQPWMELKGINDSGKLYEYSEEFHVDEANHIKIIQPLLDRTDEMEYFYEILDKNNHSDTDRRYSALLMIGENRVGKTCLLEHMVRHSLNKKMKLALVYVTTVHSTTPYLTLNQIVNKILNLKDSDDEFSKEKKIIQTLNIYFDDLCYLNPILNVKFLISDLFKSEDLEIKLTKAKTAFRQLLSAISDSIIIALDDIQYLDAHSWEFISIMLEMTNFTVVMTIVSGYLGTVNDWFYELFINNKIKKIRLSNLDSYWIPYLACQVLRTVAVPRELCTFLTKKSHGSPGLMENLLIHLFSSGVVVIKDMNLEEVLSEIIPTDYVFPDAKYLRPIALLEENQEVLNSVFTDDLRNVCLIRHREGLYGHAAGVNLEATVMTYIDALTPYQQLMLKIASVIGETFSRALLVNVMFDSDDITTAKAVKKLFSMRVFTCARGSDGRESFPSSFHMNLTINQPSCDCSFKTDLELHQNLPKYAFCKAIRFKNRVIRNICYELLPINQKKEFHARIVQFLESRRHKCLSCGGQIRMSESFVGPSASTSHLEVNKSSKQALDIHIGLTKSETLIGRETELTAAKIIEDSLPKTGSGYLGYSHDIGIGSILKDKVSKDAIYKRVTVTDPEIESDSYSHLDDNFETLDMIREVLEAGNLTEWEELGLKFGDEREDEVEDNLSFIIHMEKGGSQTNFKTCTCVELALSVFNQLVHHALHADMLDKSIGFLLDAAGIYLYLNESAIALDRLNEAEGKCRDSNIVENNVTNKLSPFAKKLLLGRIYTTRADVLISIGDLEIARTNVNKAYDIFKRSRKERLLSNLFSERLKKLEINTARASLAFFNVATKLYVSLGDFRAARISSKKALQIVRYVELDLTEICNAYSNAIQLSIVVGDLVGSSALECNARKNFRSRTHEVRADELWAVGTLFSSTFRARLARGELSAAARAGFRTLVVGRFLEANEAYIQQLPDLFYVLVSKRCIREAVEIARELLQAKEWSHENEVWYYALAIDLILDSGYQLEPLNAIIRYATIEFYDYGDSTPARRRLASGIWTFWERLGDRDRARRWERELIFLGTDSSMCELITDIRAVESLAIRTAHAVTVAKGVLDVADARTRVEREMSSLCPRVEAWRVTIPRWKCIHAACQALRNTKRGKADILSAKLYADSKHNTLESTRAYLWFSAWNRDRDVGKVWMKRARLGEAAIFPHWRASLVDSHASDWFELMYAFVLPDSCV